MAKCVTPGCTTQLAKLNEGERCYICAGLVAATQRYVEEREIKVVGAERWSAGQTAKRHLRMPYVRKLAKKNVVPWDATLEEVEVVDPMGFHTMRDELVEINFFNGFMRTGIDMDNNIGSFSYDEACCVETHFPESNFLAKWHVMTNGSDYRRFRSVADEEPKTRNVMIEFEEGD